MSEKPGRREVRQEIYIEASCETVFALLTDATEIKKWQAEIVDADPVPGGVFRLAERGGMQVEGRYVEVVPYSKVVFTWGGIAGVAPGNRGSNFCASRATTGLWCGCVTIICRRRALTRTIGNGRLVACRSSRPSPKGAIPAGFASAVSDDRRVVAQRKRPDRRYPI